MVPHPRRRVALYLSIGITAVFAVVIGVSTGLALASVRNTPNIDTFGTRTTALPSQVLDREGRLITQFFSEERRELVSIDELPNHLIHALVTREDSQFFDHSGFSIPGTARAAFNLLTGRYVSGGSTITQQLAGHLYADRREFSITRKLRELWWAFQIERHWTKHEILERYLNMMYFGHGNYGVEAASQYFFGHSARDLSEAESVILVIQLANPSLYSPIRRPNEARTMQRRILDQMVARNYITAEEADYSFAEYWASYDFTRASTSTAFFEREDRAPYFSEYVRYQLQNELLLGSLDINRDGFTIHTTIDLDYQAAAERYFRAGLQQANRIFNENVATQAAQGEALVPVIDLVSLAFDIPEIRVGDAKQRQSATNYYRTRLNPMVDMLALMFGTDEQDELRFVSRISHAQTAQRAQRTTVEGALITIDNDTGHILAMIGGSQFEARNQFNRAADGAVRPGSAFKPLYYTAAIEEKTITPATMIYDSPVVFWNDDGTPYTPRNFRGQWHGPVLVREALSRSMNVPSLRILEQLGFTAALDTSGRLLGIPQTDFTRRNLVRRYPVGLGIVDVSPMEMARAFATFANQGREVLPLAIRYIEDRSGRIVLEPEHDLRVQQQRRGADTQLVSPQTAYIMTDMLKTAVERGTLAGAARLAGGLRSDIPMAGKTGTTQNWADAWTVGYSPYVTTALWYGFDRGGYSLGWNQTGAVTAGPVWMRYMKEIHTDLPARDFVRPGEGLAEVVVSTRSGLLPTENYRGTTRTEIFLSGTEPRQFDGMQQFDEQQRPLLVDRLRSTIESGSYSLSGATEPAARAFRIDLDLNVDLSPGRDAPDGAGSLSGPGRLPPLFHDDEDDFEGNPLLD
ncbi:MAG: PBP1A family penicillin-binding protein [Spirochaetaceae bacterium]|nr:MAG: PBP1A family penicillin-binding protein [Spirochaetaceae bacterium]